MRIALVYDCLYPWTVGGAERWYRAVAAHLAAEGHEVDYLTLRQWPRRETPHVPGVRVVTVGPRMALYARGRRRIMPPLVFGAGVLWHLLRSGARYDVVHTCAFPFFSLLAVAVARPLHRYTVVCDWFEVWTATYWRSYLGRVGGAMGHAVQRLCAHVEQVPFCFSQVHAERLREAGDRDDVRILRGLYAGPFAGVSAVREPAPLARPPVVVFAGRLIREKRAAALLPALRHARVELADLRLEIIGDGPERRRVEEAVATEGLGDAVTVRGFVPAETFDAALASAACLVVASEREGYGLVVVDALARGCPVVVVDHPDSGAAELVDEGVNGFIARSDDAVDLGTAIVRAVRGGEALRTSTAEWFAAHADELALDSAMRSLVDTYRTHTAESVGQHPRRTARR